MPAGAYDRVLDPNTGRNIVDPNSFHYLPKTPITFIQFISAYSGGFTNAASMIFMTLVVGGTFGIINELGIIPAALAIILKKFDKNREMAIPFLILVFGLFESFMGAPELCIIFLPMILPLVLDLGFDTMTALAIVICGNCVGYRKSVYYYYRPENLPASSLFCYVVSCHLLLPFLRDHCMVYFKICEENTQKSYTQCYLRRR